MLSKLFTKNLLNFYKSNNLLNSMFSKPLGVMFKVKQLFTKNHLLLLLIALFLVHFNSLEVICSQSLKVSKSYQYNQVTSIKKL